MDEGAGKPMKINCVILNYNDAETAARLVHMIHDYDYLEQIVVVDNASTDDSWEYLQILRDEKTAVIRTEKNGGYGAGNNAGIRYAVEVNGATHVLIANPDVIFTENCLIQMSRVFSKHPDVGVVAASMEDETFGRDRSHNGWRLHGFVGELLAMGPVSRRMFRPFLNYPESYFRNKKAVYVDAVHGSMLMVDAKAFCDCGGYDEGIFLYQEEEVLGWRMKTSGYRTVLLLNQTYQHEHSVTISRTYESLSKRQKLRNESTLYYMKHYLYINLLQQCLAKLWFQGILIEDWAASWILRLPGGQKKCEGETERVGNE